MAIKDDIENQEIGRQEGVQEPLIEADKKRTGDAPKGHHWMVYFSTFVAVCGSYEFGACVSNPRP